MSKPSRSPVQIIEEIDQDNNKKWEAAFRATILSSTAQRLYSLIGTMDQKAQGIIFLNSLIIPAAISQMDKEAFTIGMILMVVTAILSIFTAILSIYPKRRGGSKPDGTHNLLHFGDIGRMKEADYLEQFRPVFNDPGKLGEAAAKDLHDISRRILLPKTFWLKMTYILFFVGNLLALACVVYFVS